MLQSLDIVVERVGRENISITDRATPEMYYSCTQTKTFEQMIEQTDLGKRTALRELDLCTQITATRGRKQLITARRGTHENTNK